jgi:hypothetical protein
MKIHSNQVIVLHELTFDPSKEISDDTFQSSYVFFKDINEALMWLHNRIEGIKHRVNLGYIETLYESPLFVKVSGENLNRRKISLDGKPLDITLKELYVKYGILDFRISIVVKEEDWISTIELCSKFVGSGLYV